MNNLLNKYKQNTELVWTQIDFVERRSKLSYDEFVQEYASIGKPVIITDVVKNWRAYTKWNLDFFKSNYGPVKIKVQDYNPSVGFTRSERILKTMRIDDYVDYMTEDAIGKLLYLRDFCAYNHPELWEDCEEPIYFNNWCTKLPSELLKKFFGDNGIFIGPKDTSVGLHYDSLCKITWVAMISGQKKVVLLAPDQAEYLYEGRVNCFNPDLEKFPLYTRAKPVEFILSQGELMYMPPNWWHQVINLEDTIALVTSTINEWNHSLYYEELLKEFPITGHLFPLIFKFPRLFSTLVSIDNQQVKLRKLIRKSDLFTR